MVHYSIHTLELLSCISHDVFYKLTQSLKNHCPSVETKVIQAKTDFTITSRIYRRLPFYGINSMTLKSVKYKNHALRYLLYLYINPFQASHACRRPVPRIVETENIDAAMHIILDSLANVLNPDILNALTLNRLDFCANLTFPAQIQAEEYVSLLKRGVPPKTLSEYTYFNASQHRHTPYRDSLLLKCGSYSFQIYSKYQQMKQRFGTAPDGALGMVRIELRASKQKLGQLAKKYGVISPKTNYLEFLSHAPSITQKEIPNVVSKMVGKHNFYRYQEIKNKIENSDFKDRDKDLMLHIMFYLSKHSSSAGFLEKFNFQNADWKKILKKFDKLECSPIPVPRTYRFPVYPGTLYWDSVF